MKNSTISIKAERFNLVVPTTEIADKVCDYYLRNKAHLLNWEPIRPEEYYTIAFWKKQLKNKAIAFDEFKEVTFYLLTGGKDKAKVIGQCTFSNITLGVFQACNLGYSIDKEYEGKGYMREALELAIEYMFERGLHRIQANFMPVNEKSSGLLKRLDFSIEGYARDYLFINGKWADHVLSSLTNKKLAKPV